MKTVLALAVALASLVPVGAATASPQLTSPPHGATVWTSHPTFRWTLPPNEESFAIYVSKRPETTPQGEFYDENLVDVDLLESGAREWAPSSPLYARAYWWMVTSQDRDTFSLYRSAPSAFRVAARAQIASLALRRWTYLNELGITARSRANTQYAYVSARILTLRGGRLWSARKRQSFYPPNSAERTYFTWRTRGRVQEGQRLRLRVTLRAGGAVIRASRIFRAP